MRTSWQGIAAILAHEGIVPGPYRDSKGVWTYGAGHTAAAGAPDPFKMPRGMPSDVDAAIEHALNLFFKDLAKYEREVTAALRVPVAQHEFDAMVSFHYNTGAIARAEFVKLLNAGDRHKAGIAIMNWRKPTEVIPRREAEQNLFMHAIYPSKGIPVWQVDKAGNVVWRRLKSISQPEVQRMVRPRLNEVVAKEQKKVPAGTGGVVAIGLGLAAWATGALWDIWDAITALFGG